jgi:hypothetical protein
MFSERMADAEKKEFMIMYEVLTQMKFRSKKFETFIEKGKNYVDTGPTSTGFRDLLQKSVSDKLKRGLTNVHKQLLVLCTSLGQTETTMDPAIIENMRVLCDLIDEKLPNTVFKVNYCTCVHCNKCKTCTCLVKCEICTRNLCKNVHFSQRQLLRKCQRPAGNKRKCKSCAEQNNVNKKQKKK